MSINSRTVISFSSISFVALFVFLLKRIRGSRDDEKTDEQRQINQLTKGMGDENKTIDQTKRERKKKIKRKGATRETDEFNSYSYWH